VSSLVTPNKPAEPQILVGSSKTAQGAILDDRDLHSPALWFGIILTLVTLANFALLWWRPQFGNAEWEFSTIGQTIDRIPLLVVSICLLVYGVLTSGSVKGARILAAFCVLLALWIIGSTVLYGMASLTALKLVPGNQIGLVRRTVAKNLFGAGMYVLLFGATGIQLWRRTRGRGR
jgi:amino acid transporter